MPTVGISTGHSQKRSIAGNVIDYRRNAAVSDGQTRAADDKDGIGSTMGFVGKMRGVWARRFAVAAVTAAALPGLIGFVGGTATAGAFSKPGLPVEYLMV